MAPRERVRIPWFTSGDVDGFFGLFFSGFPDHLLIVGLAPVCGLPVSLVAGRVLPGVAISVFAGNLFMPGKRVRSPGAPAAPMLQPYPSASTHPPSLPMCS